MAELERADWYDIARTTSWTTRSASITDGSGTVLFEQNDIEVPTVEPHWKAADWHERETWEMFGVAFDGHCYTDYTFHFILAGDVQPNMIGEIGEAIQAGVASFKIFTTFFARCPTGHLWEIFQQVAKAGGIMARKLKNMPADGLSIGMAVTESFGYAMLASKKAGYAAKDFTYIATTTSSQMGIVANTAKGWKTFKDMIAEAKSGKVFKFAGMSPKHADINFLIEQKLPTASQSDKRLWAEELRGLPLESVREILQLKQSLESIEGLTDPPETGRSREADPPGCN